MQELIWLTLCLVVTCDYCIHPSPVQVYAKPGFGEVEAKSQPNDQKGSEVLAVIGTLPFCSLEVHSDLLVRIQAVTVLGVLAPMLPEVALK